MGYDLKIARTYDTGTKAPSSFYFVIQVVVKIPIWFLICLLESIILLKNMEHVLLNFRQVQHFGNFMINSKFMKDVIQDYFDVVSKYNSTRNHKGHRTRVKLKQRVIHGERSRDKVQGHGDYDKCFSPNFNFQGQFS